MPSRILLGSIVLLKQPYKPTQPVNSLFEAVTERELREQINATPFALQRHISETYQRTKAYKKWKGFTHGILVEVVDADHVSLHLFDPLLCVLYIEHLSGIPTYVDFHINEITLLRTPVMEKYTTVQSELTPEDFSDSGTT